MAVEWRLKAIAVLEKTLSIVYSLFEDVFWGGFLEFVFEMYLSGFLVDALEEKACLIQAISLHKRS